MTPRTLIGLGVALVVLALLAVYGQRDEDSFGAQNAGKLLPDLEAALDEVDRLAVVGPESEPVATLERREDGWSVAEKDGYPADVVKIRQVLLDLAEAQIVEQKTSNPDYYDRLGVQPIESDTAVGVALTAGAGGMDFPTVIVGDLAGNDYRYARRADDAVSYLVDRELDVPRVASEWVDPAIVDIRGMRVRQVTIEHPDGETLQVSKDDPEQTNFTVEAIPEGRELQYPGVANVIGNALRELRLEDVESAATSPDAGQEPVRVTFRTFDGLIVTAAGFERGEEAWVEFAASVEPEAAGGEAGEAGGDADDSAAGEQAEAAGEESTTAGAQAAASADENATANEQTAAGQGSETAASEPRGSASDDAEADETPIDPRAEAASINERVAGWRYRIPTYQFDQMSRRMDDLLRAVEEP